MKKKKPEATKSLRTHVQNITDKIKIFEENMDYKGTVGNSQKETYNYRGHILRKEGMVNSTITGHIKVKRRG